MAVAVCCMFRTRLSRNPLLLLCCLLGALAWAPRVLPSVEPFATVVPVQVALGLGFLALWLRSIVGAWQGR